MPFAPFFGGWFLFPIFGLVIMGIVVVRSARFADGGFCHARTADDSIAIARRRYAAGEIDKETYQQIRRDLH
ncbi:MAG: SHOCT domain-containing protein [Clostridia bacterium]